MFKQKMRLLHRLPGPGYAPTTAFRRRRRSALAAVTALAFLAAAPPVAAQGVGPGVSYRVPADNPYVGRPGAQPEIYAYGLRNPWRFSFDRASGDLAIADVGQGAVEEIDFAPRGQDAGANYGWNCFEGRSVYAGCSAPGHVEPVHERFHSQGACSITGGYVVRDPALAALAGRYVYGDFCQSELRSVVLAKPSASDDRGLGVNVSQLVSFGEDAGGRLYVASLGGAVSRLVPGGAAETFALDPVGAFASPTFVAGPPGDPGRLMVVERGGRVRVVRDGQPLGEPFLDVSGSVSTAGEGGLLSIAFSPDYQASGRLYLYFTAAGSGDIHVEEVRRSAANPDRADPASRRTVLVIPHRTFQNHKGGQLQFGPDGLLYVATGDGGGGGDPFGKAQNLGSLLGKLLRIDPQAPAPPVGPGPDATAPRLALGGRRTQRVLRRRAVLVSARCNERCSARASGTVSIRGMRKRLRLAPAARELSAGATATLRLRVPRAARARLRRALLRRRRVRASIEVSARDPAGNHSVARRAVRLVR